MKLLITLVVAVVLGLAAVWFLPLLQGYVLIRTGGLAMEMSVLVLLLMILGAVLLLHATIWLWNMPGNVVKGMLDRRAQNQLELGLLALSEGDWSRAEKALRLSARKSANPAPQYLAAAQAASQSGPGNEDRIEAYLDKANESSRAQHPVLVTRAQLLLAAGDPGAALELLNQIRRPREDRPKVLELLARCFERLEKWDELSELVPALSKHGLMDPLHGQRIESMALKRKMARASDVAALVAIWNGLPKARRQQSDTLADYAENATKLGQGPSVEKDLRQALNRQWSDRLALLYGQLPGVDAPGRLKSAEKWLSLHPDNAVLHLTLARLCVECQLWGKAREHFETSVSLQPLAEAHRELGDLLARDGDAEAALASYRKAVDRLQQTMGSGLESPQ